MRMRVIAVLIVFLFACAMPIAVFAHGDSHETTSTATQGPALPGNTTELPEDAKPPGERNPLIAVIAAGTILVAGVAGIFIYRTIKEGL